MLSPKDYISLESAASAIKAKNPLALHELSQQILSVLIPESQFNPSTICVVEGGRGNPDFPLTYADIGAYFLAATGRHVPVLLEAEFGAVASNRVMVRRDWVRRQLQQVGETLRIDVAIQEPAANHRISVVEAANSRRLSQWVDQPPPMDAKGYEQLKAWLLHQNDQRRASDEASRLSIANQNLRTRAEIAESILGARNAEISVYRNNEMVFRQQISHKDRVIQELSLKLQALTEKESAPPQQTHVERRNFGIRDAKAAAQMMARELWITEEFASLRVGEMANEILGRMCFGEHSEHMPDTWQTVRDWLNEGDTPLGARKPGRPRKKK